MEDHHQITQWIGNVIGGGVIAAAMLQWVPIAAAVVALIWYFIQIWESKTVQRWLRQRMRRKLLSLHQQTADLELRLVDTTDESTVEHLKKVIAMRADIDVGLEAREAAHRKANELMAAEAKKKLSPPDTPLT